MKKATKVFLIIATVCVLAGILIFSGVMILNQWNFSILNKKEATGRQVDIKEAFDSISLESDIAEIHIQPSDDNSCSVIFFETRGANAEKSATVKNGTLEIRSSDKRKWYEKIFFSGYPEITICLPKREYGSLLLKNYSGDISIDEDFTFQDITISAYTGDINCLSSSSGLVWIETNTGDVSIKSISAGSVDISVTTGDVNISSVNCTGGMKVNAVTGDVTLKDISCNSLASEGATGNIDMTDVIAKDLISVERTTGSVKFYSCDAGNLSLESTTGNISGTLLSEKVFIARSITGNVEVPESGSGGKCEVSTTTGSIRISIY